MKNYELIFNMVIGKQAKPLGGLHCGLCIILVIVYIHIKGLWLHPQITKSTYTQVTTSLCTCQSNLYCSTSRPTSVVCYRAGMITTVHIMQGISSDRARCLSQNKAESITSGIPTVNKWRVSPLCLTHQI